MLTGNGFPILVNGDSFRHFETWGFDVGGRGIPAVSRFSRFLRAQFVSWPDRVLFLGSLV